MTGAEKAKMIAAQTVDTLATMRRERDANNLNIQFQAWMDWAKREGVCRQIKDHVIDAYAECKRDLKE